MNGDFIPLSLDFLHDSGRFVEIGKREIWSIEEVLSKSPNVAYHIVALDSLSAENPGQFQELLHAVCVDFDEGLWRPLPYKSYDFESQYLDAFRYLRLGQNIGKVVLSLRGLAVEGRRISGGTFVITGGLGALGLLTAKVLAGLGAKRLVLLSRSGRVSHEGQGLESILEGLQNQTHLEVIVMRCDVSDEAAVVSMLSAVRELCEDTEGIDGVVHSAGTLRDAIIRGGGAASGFDEVWSAKAQSAYWLHKHTAADKLRLFVVFSSITAAIGNIGQSSYGAANNFMDGLVERRVRMGLAGQSIRWPAISDMGMAAATGTEGFASMSPSQVEALYSVNNHKCKVIQC